MQHQQFTILTDHRSLTHLSDQRLHTNWQQKAFTKLLGLDYKICYRKGNTNSATDALSRKGLEEVSTMMVVSEYAPLWVQEITKGYEEDSYSSQLLTELVLDPAARPHFSLHNGLIRYKGRVWVGDNPSLQLKLISEVHNQPIGGHSGFPVTYRKIKHLFAWKGMKKQVQ